ncbi:hypothetical protein [Evansella cellulosilytica]|uniref:Uncharacterized protein n=1 Tax=Evansella cellulosilytica (strain ATCC 21833 / DSM 2522 / FERM P-1141 / JCM 9156 / N-4) TaxID=649639 RepID=E6TUX2_EVAC2|nr:hypothetical protein [Evansella cellulosilytica]ADU32124.1 hypothetical protein Bcell_3885 [Evansella cellulosilytica DSM 2522]
MSEKQMDRFEGMLTQLVSMVGHLKEDVDTLKADMTGMKATQEKQHAEVMGKLELLRMDQEITWQKTVENERNIERLTRQISNN